MKWLLFFILPLGTALAQSTGGTTNEIIPEGVSENTFVSAVKEMQVEQTLMNSAEVRECLEKAKYEPNGASSKKIADAEDCFRKKFNQIDGARIKQLSDQLGLQNYKLVQSQNVKEITKYLSNRLYKAMTGVDRDEENLAQAIKNQSFRNKKMADQKDFIDLYKTQLTKNALFEINRFCVENLRLTSSTDESSFQAHWAPVWNQVGQVNYQSLNDEGKGAFGRGDFMSNDKAEIYKNIQASFGNTSMDAEKLGDFFNMCTGTIAPLCEKYQKDTTQDIGKNACLTMDRLRNIRKAIADTSKVIEQWEDGRGDSSKLTIEGLSFYDRGATDKSNSIDSLTNISSADFLNAKDSSQIERKAKECEDSPELQACEQFLVQGDLDKTKHEIALKMTLQKELELQRVMALKKEGQQKLEEYLTEQGYLSLLKELKDKPNMTDDELRDSLDDIFTAKREAVVTGIDDRLKSRQIRPDDKPSEQDILNKATAGIEDAKQERARLAQVVFFNNIISSYVSLSKKVGDKTEVIGRNLNTLKVEFEGQKTAQIDGTLFENLRVQGDKSGGKETDFDSVEVGSLFDGILGTVPSPTPSTPGGN